MPHGTGPILTLAVSLAFAFLGGLLATRLRLPVLVGYLLAGVAVGPFTPGFVADPALAGQLAEIGVILLMFGVGMHFSLADLLAVRHIALPGAVAQIAAAVALVVATARLWGWPLGGALVFGLAPSVASTVVLLRALEERSALDSLDGRIAVGWLIVEDLVMVLVLILLPAVASPLGGGPADPHATGDVLFFVAVGMLFDPAVLVRQPLRVVAVVAIIVLGKSLAALAIVRLFRYPVSTALTVSAALAQIGEFSFILAGLGQALGLLPPEGQSLIVAGALLSITLNPLVFRATGAAGESGALAARSARDVLVETRSDRAGPRKED